MRRRLARIAVVALVGVMGFSACAGPSEEERCKVSGGAWREKTMERLFASNFAPIRRLTSYVFRPSSVVSIDRLKVFIP